MSVKDLNKLSFYSALNYLKRSSFCGTATGDQSIEHDLGYYPFFEIYADFDGDGTIWAGEKIDEGSDETGGTGNWGPSTSAWTTTDTLTIKTTFKVYWLIYLDYGND